MQLHTDSSSASARYPDWLPAAKIAGEKDWVGYLGGDESVGPIILLLHQRAARVVGHPKLSHRARIAIALPERFSPEGPTEAQWKLIDNVVNSAERRIVQRKLGLLVLLVVYPNKCEVLFYCNDPHRTLAALEASRDRAAAGVTVDVSVLEDPRWDAFHTIWSKYGVPNVEIGPTAASIMKELPPAHPAVVSDEAFRKWVRNHPPRCVAGLRLTWILKVEQTSRIAVGFRLADKIGGDVGRVHAHPIDGRLVSPIHVTWKKSNETKPLFDAEVDGYQGEFRWNSQPHGSGVAAPIACPKCGESWFRLSATFNYDDAAFDLGRDQPKVEIQNYFAAARFHCTCVKCDHVIDS